MTTSEPGSREEMDDLARRMLIDDLQNGGSIELTPFNDAHNMSDSLAGRSNMSTNPGGVPTEPTNEPPPFDVDSLPPVQYLMLETLAARHRCGEALWTLPSKVKGPLRHLENRGLVGWKSGIVEGSVMAWLTDEGRRACFGSDYVAPIAAELARTEGDLGVALREATQARAKLEQPCGSCHPCMNWDAEVLRRQRQAVLDLCDEGEPRFRGTLPNGQRFPAFVDADAVRAALGVTEETDG